MRSGILRPPAAMEYYRSWIADLMKIAFVTTGYKPRINGVTTSIESFTSAFRKRGHDVTIVAPEYPGYRDKERGVVRIKSHYLFFDPEDRLANPWLASSRRKIRSLIDYGFDIIHSQTPFLLEMDAIRWARRMACPIVFTYHTLFENYVRFYARFFPASVKVIWFKKWSIWYCKQMDLIFVPSNPTKELLTSYGIRNRIEINPNGIDLARFTGRGGREFRINRDIAEDTKVLLFAGRIGWEKNIDFLFQVLKRVVPEYPNTLFLLAGDGPAREELEKLAQSEGLNDYVRFLGYLSHDELVSCYNAADLFIFASVTETQGLVLTEAMAAGTPAVAVAKMGVMDVMQGNAGGIMVDLKVEQFARAVLLLLRDSKLYAKKKREAVQNAGAWSIDAMSERMLGFYNQLIEEKRGR